MAFSIQLGLRSGLSNYAQKVIEFSPTGRHIIRSLTSLGCKPIGNGSGRKIPTNFTIVPSPLPLPGCRHLFSDASLGLDNYIETRERTEIQFKDIQDKFRQRMDEVLSAESNNMIFTEDLRNFLHLADSTTEDISLVIGMSKRFNSQHGGLRFGTFVFGPVVMRMLHYSNQPDAILQVLKDEKLAGFFDQLSSYQLAMDSLYKHGLYKDVLDVFESLQTKRLNGVKYPKNTLTLALASCYKMNTQESYERMLQFLQGVDEYGTTLTLRCVMFAAALAFNQNLPHICLEILSRASLVTHMVIRNLKIQSLTALGRVEESIPILRSVLQFDVPDLNLTKKKTPVLRETIKMVEESVKATENQELVAEFQHITKSLEDHTLISDMIMDEILCEPIQAFQGQRNNKDKDRAMLAASFRNKPGNRKQQKSWNNRYRRPGLMDME